MKNKVHLSTESRIHREVYVRFGGRLSKTCRSNTTRRRVPSLHKVFDIEKRESIKTLILTLWKKDNEPATRSEEVALSNAVSLYIRRIKEDESIVPSFNSFYEFVKTDYRRILEEKEVREKDFDLAGFLNVLEPYYRGGEYDFLLNSDKQLDLLGKRFIVFEIDQIKDHPILFPVTTIIIMELFINKMRRLKGVRKMIIIEEAWKAIAKEGMADYIRYLFKTVRKFYGEAVVVTQEVDDIISSPIVKGSIVNNSDCKILLDQRKYLNKFSQIQSLLGLTDKEKAQILSVNMSNDPRRKYKEVWFGLGGVQSTVYATEVSLEEYLCYSTEESEKVELEGLTKELGGNIELAIRRLSLIHISEPTRPYLWSMKPCFRSTGYAGSGKAAASRRPSPYSVMVVHTRLP